MIVHALVGPPCAGKTTYALEHMDLGRDVLLDLDRLADALGGTQGAASSGPVVSAALRLRESGLKWAGDQRRRQGTLWVIDTDGTLIGNRARGFTVLDPGAAVCHYRASNVGRPSWTHDEIDAWYTRHNARDW